MFPNLAALMHRSPTQMSERGGPSHRCRPPTSCPAAASTSASAAVPTSPSTSGPACPRVRPPTAPSAWPRRSSCSRPTSSPALSRPRRAAERGGEAHAWRWTTRASAGSTCPTWRLLERPGPRFALTRAAGLAGTGQWSGSSTWVTTSVASVRSPVQETAPWSSTATRSQSRKTWTTCCSTMSSEVPSPRRRRRLS
jgi:hypothetical protein